MHSSQIYLFGAFVNTSSSVALKQVVGAFLKVLVHLVIMFILEHHSRYRPMERSIVEPSAVCFPGCEVLVCFMFALL